MSNILNQSIAKLGNEMSKRYPKRWKKTQKEIAALWIEVDATARGIILDGRNLSTLNSRARNLQRISKILQRAQVADAIDSAK
jgi:hypothetical protein